ncbi:gametogenetin-binding protein 2-like [Coccinella septempunctata]|uniref:gametogenetin-binding protein 2-like n=1 Tax=Coccinella septempunctata TaxID=41139 RepID=UPI001D07E6A4|nr:gametogenetin-binding protein 2-like [Coccinella septempunctata]
MNIKEKIPKLVDVYRPSPKNPLSKRQLPLVVDENLTLVMDLNGSGIVCDNPLIKGKDLEDFIKKWTKLTEQELRSSIQISKNQLLTVLNQNVPCVGCRRSVERLYYQLFKFGHPTLEPLMVTKEGIITIQEDICFQPLILGSIFHEHALSLAQLIENQPKRNKKSLRCRLHSLDSQRSRPLTPVWHEVWECMEPECKKEVCIIEAPTLHATLETYLRKHRFCGECRTKVLKAYSLLVEEPDPCKEKGYVSSLYSGIKRCLPDKHIHLQTKTEYITKLISRAEPELLGSRRERHAKTLEIAQEEVLTCLGICMYERLHRIYMRMREEECTCQVFAAVAVDTLSRSFETAVELKQGVSQLQLLYEELAKEEQMKQSRKDQKKIKRKRRKGKCTDIDSKELCNDCDEEDDDKDGLEKVCDCSENENESIKCECNQTENPQDDNYECSNLCNNLNDSQCSTDNVNDCTCGSSPGEKSDSQVPFRCDNCNVPNGGGIEEFGKKESGSSSDHSHDCGYSSENNNGCCETGSLVSSISSSPEGSEVACSDSCCHHETNYVSHYRLTYGGNGYYHPSLQEMLDDNSDDDDDNCSIPTEDLNEFNKNRQWIEEQRMELREKLKDKFAHYCFYGPTPPPRLY